MIYTLTLNPALDRTIHVDSLSCDVANRIVEEYRFPGGKGIGVSKVLTALGTPNVALGFVGGFRGDELEALLIGEGVHCSFIRIAGDTRSNIVIRQHNSDCQMLLNSKGPEVEPSAIMTLLRQLRNLSDPEYLTIGGSLPPNIKPAMYRKCIEIGREIGCRVLLDADGEALLGGIRARPFAIKPNVHELSNLVGRPLKGVEDVLRASEMPLDAGVEVVVASMGPDGIVLSTRDLALHAVPPKVEVVNTIGAGDSAVAGFIHALSKGMHYHEAVCWAVAAGTATTLREGTALARREEIEHLLKEVKVFSLR
ncbi:MAG TPA: 1-phosphofructokinase [Methanoregulaceae archaeon]|nr:1-phosphofructokinase [Methanoregulaceae archaeon]HOV67391.1 1-phosphofructokinase [Methanoregulaceae archaeon]HQJ86928.1 1-phosphofructokinase [Methanoregulaceae archaeon]